MASARIKSSDISEVYDYRVALPLLVVGAFCIVFILISDHRATTTLKDAPSDATISASSKDQATMNATTAAGTQTLNPEIQTVDPDTPVTPTTIDTATPQSSASGSTSAGSNSESRLQSASTSSGSASIGISSSPTTNQPPVQTIESLINGTTGGVNSITTNTSKGTVNLLKGL